MPILDDEVLSMGGTIAKLATAGDNIYCWFYFSGENCNGVIQEQPKAVADILGTVYPPFVMPMTVDNESDTIPVLDIARSIEDVIKKVNPEIVYTHSIHDITKDHRQVSEATLVATRPKVGCGIKRVLAYEVPAVTDRGFGHINGVFAPNVYEELTLDEFDVKWRALNMYGALTSAYMDHVDAWARLRGVQIGVECAEAFELVWERR